MIHFVVVSGGRAAVGKAALRLGTALEATRYFNGKPRALRGTSGTWAAASLAAPDPVLTDRLVNIGDGLAILNGPVLAGHDAAAFVLERDLLAPYLATGELPDLDGSFNLVLISPRSGLRAWGDLSGQHPLYYGETGDLAVVSNRASTVAEVAGAKGHDLRALAWLIGHGNLFGNHLPASGVRYLPPGTQATVAWGGHRISHTEAPSWVWPEAGPTGGRHQLSDREWDDVTTGLVDGVASMRSWSGTIRLSLTGGKDSRLCLALASAAGMTDCVTYTMGGPDSPEVEVAAEVARVAGFTHEGGRRSAAPAPLADPPLDVKAMWRRLREHAYRYDGIVSPWDGMNDRLRGTSVHINGFGGEIYRRAHAKRFGIHQGRTVDEMVPLFYDFHQAHDPLGILRRSEIDFQRAWIENWVRRTAGEVRLDALPEKFYTDFRIGHWNGPMAQAKPGRIAASALLSTLAARKYLELAPEVRGTDRFHYEVMRRTAPHLVPIPFLRDTWPEAIRKASAVNLPSHPFPVATTPSVRTLSGSQMSFLCAQEKEIKALFGLADRQTDLGSICNVGALCKVNFHAKRLTGAKARTVLSAISIAITLLGSTQPVVDEVIQA